MNEQRWLWPFIAVAAAFILLSTARDGGWLFLCGATLLGGLYYVIVRVATQRGYEWRMQRGMGIIALPAMLALFLLATQVTGSFEVGGLIGMAGGLITLLVVGLRSSPSD